VNDQEAIEYYVQTVAAQVRAMPLADAVIFLRGALTIAGEHPAMEELRGTFRDLSSADDQLELMLKPGGPAR